MNIIIEDIAKGCSSKYTYVATFPSMEHAPFTSYRYPVQMDGANVEQILHVLNAMCYHPQVYGYLKAHIPSPFFPDKKVPNRHIPLQPLLNYLAGPSKIHCLEWKEDNIEYSKRTQGLAIKHFSTGYIFPYGNQFTTAFLETFGAEKWEDAYYRKAFTGWDFCHAELDIAACLSPFETWFITSSQYGKLCADLQNICLRLEALLGESFFEWDMPTPKENLLLNIIKQKSAFSF